MRKAGRIHGQQHYIALMERELVTFFLSSLVLLSIFLFIAFRRPWGVISPIAVVGLTVLWQVALMTALGHPLSILTMLLPTILFVVGMSDSVHIIERYIEALREGHAKARCTGDHLRRSGPEHLHHHAHHGDRLCDAGHQRHPAHERVRRVHGDRRVHGVRACRSRCCPRCCVLLPTPVPPVRARAGGLWDRAVHALLRTVIRTAGGWSWIAALLIVAVSSLFLPRLKVNNFLLEDLPDSDLAEAGLSSGSSANSAACGPSRWK